jgi:hypothetical protein
VLGGTFAPPSLRNDGTLILGGSPTINTVFTMADSSRLLLRGDNVGGNVGATFTNAFTNVARLDLTSESAGYSATLTVPTGSLVNAAQGIINVLQGAGGTRTLALQLENQGVLNLTTASGLTLARADAVHVNAGTINVTGSNFTLNQTGTAPSFTNGETGVIAMGNSRTWTTNGGLLDLRTGLVSNGTALVATTGTTTVRFLTSTVQPRVTFAATTILPDAFIVPGGDSLRVLGGTFAPPSLRNDGTLILGGSPTINTVFTMADSSRLLLRGDNVGGNVNATFTNAFTNTARIDLTSESAGYSATLTVPTGSLVNAASGLINAQQGAGGARTLAAQLANEGALSIGSASGMTLARADAAHLNTGTITASAGDFTLTQSGTAPSFTNDADGLIQLAANRTWTTNGGLLDLRTGLVQGRTARLTANATATVRFTTAAVEPRVTFAAGATLPDPFTVPYGDSLRVLGGTFAPPSLLVQGLLAIEGTTTVTSAVTSDSGSQILVRGNNAGGNVVATFTNGLTVGPNAFLDLTAENAGYSSTLNVTSGLLTIAPTAQLTTAAGSSGTRTIGAELLNQGAVQINIPTTLARADAAHVNAAGANIAVFGGNLTVTQTGTAPTFTNNGTITVAATRSFIGNGGAFNLETGTMLGSTGTFQTLGTTVARFQPANVRPALNFSAGTTVPVAFVTAALTDTVRVRGGTFAPTSLVNNGQLLLEGVSTINTATFTNGATGLVSVQGSNALGNASVQIPQGMTNSGILRLTTFDAGYSVALGFGTSTLTNAAGSTLDIAQGAGGTRSLTAGAIDNLGTIAGNATGTINGPISQRSLLTVATSRTLTLSSLLTLFSGSTVNVTLGGTLNASGGCTNLGALLLENFVCP